MAPTTKRYGLPYVWVTWVTGLLAGEDSCEHAAWFKAHFKFTKVDRGFDLAAWKASHAEMVMARVRELEADGWTVTIEDQNDFKWKGQTAILSGKCDIVARRGREILIVDCKGGQPKDADWWQVLIYLVAFPKVYANAPVRTASDVLEPLVWRGEVCYSDHRVQIAAEELNDERRTRIFNTMRMMGADTAPRKVPSRRECGWCDIPKGDCPDRIDEQEPASAMATEF